MNSFDHWKENPSVLLSSILARVGNNRSDGKYIKILYRWGLGRKMNLENSKRLSEKLLWLKQYNRQPLYTQLVDKYQVKEYVSSMVRIGKRGPATL